MNYEKGKRNHELHFKWSYGIIICNVYNICNMRKINYQTIREIAIFTVIFLSLTIIWSMAYLLPAYFCENCDSELMKEIGCGILIIAPLANMIYIDIRIIIDLIRNRK